MTVVRVCLDCGTCGIHPLAPASRCLCDSCLAKARADRPNFEEAAYQSGFQIGVLRERVARLEREIDWLRQTVHRAHHEGPLDECTLNTCDAALRLLEKR